jgi:Uma2 family endonuclease
MNIHSNAPTDPDAFLRWNEGREGKRELVRGSVVEYMINVTRAHAYIVTHLLIELGAALDSRRFEAYAVDLGMKTPDGVRYPDVVVDAAGGDLRDLAVTAPIFVCEVLSPSSLARDMVEKLGDYTKISSVQAYLVLSQDEPRGWLWSRGTDGWSGPLMIAGPDGIIPLPALSVELRLGTLYPDSLLQ